jgi:hypothetical protein
VIATFLVADTPTSSFFLVSRFHGCEVSAKQFATHRWWQFNASQAIRVVGRIRRLSVADIFKQSAQADAVSRSTQ